MPEAVVDTMTRWCGRERTSGDTMTMQTTKKAHNPRHYGPLKPHGIRLAKVLGELKTASAGNLSPVYDLGPAATEGLPMNLQKDLKTRAAFEAILAPHMDELYGAAVRLARSPSDADDVLQEAMARAWTFWERFEAGTNVRAWMHRILYNTFVNGYRKRRREREVLAKVHDDRKALVDLQAPAPSGGTGLGDEVKEALGELPQTFRAVVERVDLHGQSYRETAEALGCPVGTVMSRLHRGRRLLKERLRTYAATEGYVAAA